MGEFLKVAGFRDVKQAELLEAVRSLYGEKGWRFEEVPLAPGYGWESRQSSEDLEHIGSSKRGAVMCFATYSETFIDTEASSIGRASAVAIAMQIYEGSQWTYSLASSGKWVDEYINIPDYFGPASEAELKKYAGSPQLLANAFPPLVPTDVANYSFGGPKTSLRRTTRRRRTPAIRRSTVTPRRCSTASRSSGSATQSTSAGDRRVRCSADREASAQRGRCVDCDIACRAHEWVEVGESLRLTERRWRFVVMGTP